MRWINPDLGRRIPSVVRVVFGSKILRKGPILEGPRAEKGDRKPSISATPDLGERIRLRGLPLRPYVHVRISRISGRRAQLPQIMYFYCLSAPLLWNPAPSRFHVLVLTKLRRRVLAVRSSAISFSFTFLLKSIDFERRAGSGEAGDRKIIDFQLKSFEKVSIFERRAGSNFHCLLASGDRPDL